MTFRVELTRHALDDLARLDGEIAKRIIRKVEWLADHMEVVNPQPLKGRFVGMYKLVVSDWRVLYTADFVKKVLTIHFIGHRRDVYK